MDFYKSTAGQKIPVVDTDTPEGRAYAMPVKVKNKSVGYGYVPRDYNVYPEEMFDHPDSMFTIPESEWDARFDEQEQLKSSLEHLYLSGPGGTPVFVNLDQDGDGYCATADTEVLTEDGWTMWPDYDWDKCPLLATVNPITQFMEYQAPLAKHVYNYNGPMVYSTNRRVDFGMTPNHRMLVRKWDESRRTLSDDYSFQLAGNLGWYVGLMPAPQGCLGTELVELEIEDDRRYDGDDLLALLSLVISDGYAGGSDKTRNWVSFCCFNENRYPKVAAMAQRVGFRETSKGIWTRYDAGALANWIRTHCYSANLSYRAENKKIPTLVKVASQRQIKLFLDFYGDKDHGKDYGCFYSSSKRLIDDLQELHLKIGKRSSVHETGPRQSVIKSGGNEGKTINSKTCYSLYVAKEDRLCLDRKKHIERDNYNGLVYCATVPNGTLITRRNGTVLISGNCWIYSNGSAMMLCRLIQNQPLVRLNPHSAGAIIKGGRDEGGWCGLGARFVMANGMAPEGTGPDKWPLHSRSLSNDTPAMRASMARYKMGECFMDLTKRDYDHTLTRLQLATSGFMSIPCPSDFNWWSHSVCQIRWVRIEAGSWGPLILNSWKGWGRHGLGVLRGSQATANGALAYRTAIAA